MDKKPLKHGAGWTSEEEYELGNNFFRGIAIKELTLIHKRSSNSIRKKLKKLGLLNESNIYAELPPLGRETGDYPGKVFETVSIETIDENNEISTRLYNCLNNLGVSNIEDTLKFTRKELFNQPNFGRKSYLELRELQKKYCIFWQNIQSYSTSYSSKTYQVEREDVASTYRVNLSLFNKYYKEYFYLVENFNQTNDVKIINESLKVQRKLQIELEHMGGKLNDIFNLMFQSKTEFSPLCKDNATANEIIELLDKLIPATIEDPRSADILRLRLGICEHTDPLSLQAIGNIYSITRERVRQLEKKAKNILSSKVKSSSMELCLTIRFICNTIFSNKAEDAYYEIINFCYDFFGDTICHNIAAILFVIQGLEPNVLTAENKAKQLLIQNNEDKIAKIRNERDSAKYNRLWLKAIQNAVLPSKIKKHSQHLPGMNIRSREINEHGFGNTGSFYSKKCQRHVHYESALEFTILQVMENTTMVIWYREQPMEIPYSIRDTKMSYYPDVALLKKDGIGIIIEVKSYMDMALLSTIRKANAAVKFLHSQGIGYLITDDRGGSFRQLAKIDVDSLAEEDLLKLITEEKIVNWEIYRNFRNKHKLTFGQFASIIIRNNLSYLRHPFRLSRLESKFGFEIFLK